MLVEILKDVTKNRDFDSCFIFLKGYVAQKNPAGKASSGETPQGAKQRALLPEIATSCLDGC
ncbi:hypothetical protein KS419_13605, partial [Bacillus tamaricis]